MHVIDLVAWKNKLRGKIRNRKREYARELRRISDIRESEEEIELSRKYFFRLYERMGWGLPPFPPKEYCGVSLEPIETPAVAAAEVSRPPARPQRSHRRGFVALSPTH